MLGFLFVNLFIVGIVLIGAGFAAAGAALFREIDMTPGGLSVMVAALIAAAALYGAYHVSRWFYIAVGRMVNPKRKLPRR